MSKEECRKELAEALYYCACIAYNSSYNSSDLKKEFAAWKDVDKEHYLYYTKMAEELDARFSYQPLCRLTVTVDPEWDTNNKGVSIV